jgi:hypothetical protein
MQEYFEKLEPVRQSRLFLEQLVGIGCFQSAVDGSEPREGSNQLVIVGKALATGHGVDVVFRKTDFSQRLVASDHRKSERNFVEIVVREIDSVNCWTASHGDGYRSSQ